MGKPCTDTRKYELPLADSKGRLEIYVYCEGLFGKGG